MFSNKFRMSFGAKKPVAPAVAIEVPKPATVDERAEDSDSKSSSTTEEKPIENNFLGAIQRMQRGYEEQLETNTRNLPSAITPSLPNETPVLKPPAATIVVIQEERPDSGGVADLFEGKVGTLGHGADVIERVAPMWLADVLLRVGTDVVGAKEDCADFC